MIRSRWSPRRRALGALLTVAAATVLAAESAFAAVSWAPVKPVTDPFAFNAEQSLARTVKDSTPYLHAVYVSTKIGANFVSDSGPFVGAYYLRGNSNANSWANRKRLNPQGKHATSTAIVASDQVLYAAYVTLGHWFAYDPAEPRPITVRINRNHGVKSAWLDRKVTSVETRVDRPALAAWAGRGFLMVYTNADTGEIVLVTCADLTVEANGCTSAIVGTTTRLAPDADDGFEGLPVVAASGDDITVAWHDAEEGGIAYITKDGEADWTAPVPLTTADAASLSIAAKDTRVGFAWVDENGVKVRLVNAGVLGDPVQILTTTPDTNYRQAYSTAIALTSPSTLGIAFGACHRGDCTGGSSTGVDLRWRESNDNGANWTGPKTVASYSAKSSRRINDFPSVVMTSTKRFVMFNTASATFSTYRIFIRIGSD